MWDKLLDQIKLTLNILRQAALNLLISAWVFFNSPFYFAENPLVPMGYKVIIHDKTNTRKYWYQRGREGYNIGPVLDHSRCFSLIDKQSK